ncbi:related to reductase RED1 [Rhynchosporium secalis]|uniref:Related to reductase RED1 n=1 Tax=Rhynchosporium secalis TaxID=38038 RepID=A0A1E1MAF5_RHYSE|nr:related to reductase RED1 [Rhynchosporium secalis]
MVQSKSLILAKHPVGLPIPGQDLIVQSSEFDLSAPPPPGGVVLKLNYISYDPYQRGRMRPAGSGYMSGFQLNEPLDNNAISTIVTSDNPRFKKGDVVIGYAKFSEYQTLDKSRSDKEEPVGGLSHLDNPLGLDEKIFLGGLGMSGLTAYSSFYEIGKPKKGEVIFISAASGAVGQIVGQLAKREGLLVIGSVGSEKKLDFIKGKLGFDEGFNYKSEDAEGALRRILKRLGKEGIDIYYDNVGGEQLDAAIATASTWARIVSCGSVSQSSKKPEDIHGIKNMPMVTGKRLNIRGFIVFDPDFGPKYREEHQKNVQKWIKDREITIQMEVTDGIDKSAEGLVGMLKGDNFGKAVLKVADL